MAGKDYDVAAAFQAIEYELINSFFRNMKKHTVDEVTEQKEWEMWQVKQLQELTEYKKRNAKKYGTKFTDINKTVEEMIRLSNEQGQMDQEAEILTAVKDGLKPERAPESLTAQFFRTNDRKLDALIDATVGDMEKAETAILRKAEDVYRKTIFNAAVFANTGAGTYEKAVDMATKDFMAAGLTCVEYKNGTKHSLSDYADMAVRTANKRAYLQGEGAKRQEWGIHTVIVNKRLNACPHCMPFAGKVFIDDVWGGGTAADGDYPLLSEAVKAGLYHPRCKDSHTAFFPGISDNPKRYTKQEVKEAEKQEELERKADYAERQAEKYQRVADTRLDPENKKQEQARADKWKDFNKQGEESFRAKTIKTEEDLRMLSNSPVLTMDTLHDIVIYFDGKYGIEIQDFQELDLLKVKETLSGYDDLFTMFPEAGKLTQNIMFSPNFEDSGKMSANGFSVIGPSGLAYGTGLHEAAHALDYAKSSPELHTFSNAVLMQAIREAGIKVYKRNINKIIGSLFLDEEKVLEILSDPSELFAYSLETALGGGNKFADVLLDVTRRYYEEFV